MKTKTIKSFEGLGRVVDDRAMNNEELLRALVGAFVTKPGAIEIEMQAANGRSEMITLRVAQEDYRSVYGSMGKNMTALQTMLSFIGKRDGKEIIFVLHEPPEQPYRFRPPMRFEPNNDWNQEPVLKLLKQVLSRIVADLPEIKTFSAAETTNVLVVPQQSSRNVIEVLIPYLAPIFAAIGRQQGRKLHLYVPQEVPELTEQKR